VITGILLVVIIGLISLFSVQNSGSVSISLLHWKFDTSLPVLVCVAVLLGVVVEQLVRHWASKWSIGIRKK
jgi:uncharacterized integral membrane protein